MDYQPNPRPSITRVWAKNFRSIGSVEIDLGPLTVLVGPNASGKSNLLDVLRFVADALDHDLEVAITDRGGLDRIGRRAGRGRTYGPEIGLRFESPDAIIEYEFAIANKGGGGYQVKREYARVEYIKESGEPLEIEIKNGRLTKPRGSFHDRISNVQEALKDFGLDPRSLHLPFSRLMYVLVISLERHGYMASTAFLPLVEYVSHMHFYHIFPNVLRDPQKMGDRYPLEERGENLASVLQDMVQQESPFLGDLKQALGLVVPGIRDVRVSRAGSFLVVELKHEGEGRTGRQTWFDLSYESDGTLRLLGLLVTLYQTPAPSLIAVEEPELTIHPGALAVLADIIKEASLRGQVLVTTHSPDLIDRLPVECIRAVELRDGVTTVGPVAEYQKQSVKEGLFLPGELHRMEGLQIASNED